MANMLYLLGDRLLGRERMEYVKEAFNRFVRVGGLPRHIFAEEEVTINEDFLSIFSRRYTLVLIRGRKAMPSGND